MPRSTNFLLTAAARTLKIKDIFKMGEDAAWEQFVAIRFADNNGEATALHVAALIRTFSRPARNGSAVVPEALLGYVRHDLRQP